MSLCCTAGYKWITVIGGKANFKSYGSEQIIYDQSHPTPTNVYDTHRHT